MVGVATEMKEHMKRFSISSDVPKKTLISTHFEMKNGCVYYGMNQSSEQKLISLLARSVDANIPTYINECFSEKYALVFDIDKGLSNNKGGAEQTLSENSSSVVVKSFKEILSVIYDGIRGVMDISTSDVLNCVVFSACSPQKMSYHIHFPDIIVNKPIAKLVYDTIFKRNKWARDYIDEQIINTQKLRMAFSDKWDKSTNQPVGRKLVYFGSYNCRELRYIAPWETDSYELLSKASVRRNDYEEIHPIKNCFENLASITMNEKMEMSMTDFALHDDSDFDNLDPEYYSMQKVQHVIEYIKQRYQYDAKTMCTKITRYMNKIVVMITDHPGKVIFLVRKYNDNKKKQTWSFVQKSQRDFLQLFQHIKVMLYLGESGGNKAVCKSIGEVWMTHAEKRTAGTIVFDPHPFRNNDNNFNIFQGLFLQIEDCVNLVDVTNIDYKQKIAPILNHIREVWCADNPRVYTYVIKWLAHAICRPWIKMGCSLVLVGNEGCGKSLLINAIGSIFGQYFLTLTDMDDLLGRFTSILCDKLFVFADEVVWGGCKSVSGKLKGIITEPQIRCEHKGFDTYMVESFTNFILATNNHWAVPAGENARRWCCLGCTAKYNGNVDYFRSLYSCLYSDDMLGLKCLVAYFAKDINLNNFVPSQFPMTSLLRAQKENSFDSLESWWDQILHRGYVINWQDYQMIDPNFDHERSSPGMVKLMKGPKYGYQMIPLQRVYNTYQEEMRGGPFQSRISSFQRFKQFLRDRDMFQKCKAPVKKEFAEVWIIINFKKCRASWRKVYNDPDMIFEHDLSNDDAYDTPLITLEEPQEQLLTLPDSE